MGDEKIEGFNKASLVSLKAELVRKREEVDPQPKRKIRNGLKFKNQDVGSNKNDNSVNNKPLEDLTSEEKELEKLTTVILAAKSQMYDKLCNKELTPDSSQNFLVNFDAKKNERRRHENINDTHKQDTKNEASFHSNNESDDDDGWVDYVDSFGRTRRCLREDLPFYQKLDRRLNNDQKNKDNPEKMVEANEEFRTWDMAREALRKKWEQQEQSLAEKQDVHYADILFDEARQHGTAFYKFSVNEDERRRQQKELLRMREETEKRQENYKLIKQRRETMLKARINAAKKRKRIRLGLPDEEESEEKNSSTQEGNSIDHEKNVNNLDDAKILENLEKIRRLKHVRPWDVGKEGVSTLKVMSQEEWNEMKRQDRLDEFAPPSSYEQFSYTDNNTDDSSIIVTNRQDSEQIIEDLYNKVTNQDNELLSPVTEPSINLRKFNPLYFTTKKNKLNSLSESQQRQSSLIDSDDDENKADVSKVKASKILNDRGVEIPPPVSYDTSNVNKLKINKTCDMAQSIEAGLKFLKHKTEIDENKREKGFM